MKDEIRIAIYLITVGAMLVVYGHSAFATKEMVVRLDATVREGFRDLDAYATKESVIEMNRKMEMNLDRMEDILSKIDERLYELTREARREKGK